MSYTIPDLRIPLSYEVRLAPITTYSTGEYASRTVQYSERECSYADEYAMDTLHFKHNMLISFFMDS